MFLSLCMMVKDESKNIIKSLNSVKDIIESCIIYDTGSTDNTIDIIRIWCHTHDIPLHIKEGEFVDFSTSRNTLLEFADTIDSKYLLLLDSNDEMKESNKFIQFLKQNDNGDNKVDGIMLQQCWKLNDTIDKYWNVRCIKNKCGWRYTGRVHEWISKIGLHKNIDNLSDDHRREISKNVKTFITKAPEECSLFHDRIDDMAKSIVRFQRDKVLLLEDHRASPENTRIMFYLAQTLSSTQDYGEAFYYYKLRSLKGGFPEEVFHSLLRLGTLSMLLKHPWVESLKWFLKAYDHSHRVEPLCQIAQYYIQKHNFRSAFMYLSEAIKLDYPKNSVLFVNKFAHDYLRWHLMGRCAYYVKAYQIGLDSCMKAIPFGKEVDKNNLEFYKEKI